MRLIWSKLRQLKNFDAWENALTQSPSLTVLGLSCEAGHTTQTDVVQMEECEAEADKLGT